MRFKNFSVMNKFVVMQYVEELVVHIMFQTIFLQNVVLKSPFQPQRYDHLKD